jgi:hypothetical protein
MTIDRNKTNVDVNRTNYERLKSKAIEERYNIKEYTNSLIKSTLDKMEFAQRNMPFLVVDAIEGNKITLTDRKTRKLVDLRLDDVDGILHCEVDASDSCTHVVFALLMPEFAKLQGVNQGDQPVIEEDIDLRHTETI